MPRLFEFEADDVDAGYRNLQTGKHRTEREIVAALEAMWTRYEPYADCDFVQGFAREPEARFWEMFIGCALLDAGKVLLRSADRPRFGGRPDICVLEEGRRVWIEAIAPTRGEGDYDQIPELIPLNDGGRVRNQPKRQIRLRITSALWSKFKVVKRYLAQGTIAGDDVVIVAIGAARFGLEAAGSGTPLALSSVFPIGNEFVQVRRDTLEVVGQGHEPSFKIERAGGAIPRTAFLDELFAPISALLWSRVSIGNMRRGERPLSLIHNPMARNPLPQRWGTWDREFVAARDDSGWTLSDVRGSEDEQS